jgi:hypothetical protein
VRSGLFDEAPTTPELDIEPSHTIGLMLRAITPSATIHIRVSHSRRNAVRTSWVQHPVVGSLSLTDDAP